MFQRKLLSVNAIRDFFEKHSIPLEAEYSLPETNINNLFLDAYLIDEVFAGFILKTVINFEKTGIQTVFKNYEEIETAYVCFLIGYSQSLNN